MPISWKTFFACCFSEYTTGCWTKLCLIGYLTWLCSSFTETSGQHCFREEQGYSNNHAVWAMKYCEWKQRHKREITRLRYWRPWNTCLSGKRSLFTFNRPVNLLSMPQPGHHKPGLLKPVFPAVDKRVRSMFSLFLRSANGQVILSHMQRYYINTRTIRGFLSCFSWWPSVLQN